MEDSPVDDVEIPATTNMPQEFSGFGTCRRSFRRFNYRLYLALLIADFIPTIYMTVRIYYVGELTQTKGINIASQLQWVNVILEVIQEALVKPLYHCIGLSIENHRETANKLVTGLLITFIIYVICTGLLAALASPLTIWMAQDEQVINETVVYVRLELMGLIVSSLVEFLMVVLVLLNAQRHIYIILLIKMILSVILDTFFLSKSLDVSLKLGVNGIAYTNIITAGITLIYALSVFVIRYGRLLCARLRFVWLWNWSLVGLFSGLDSLIRNVVYLLMILRMMNVIEEQGTYWLANTFIWSWLLLPYISLSKVLIQDTSNIHDVMDHRVKTLAYYVIVAIIAALWCLTIPGWKGFFRVVLNIKDSHTVFKLMAILTPFYMLYMINTLMDSVFYGKGKTLFLAVQSIITNILVYGTAFIIFETGLSHPTLVNISIIFGISIAVDSFITFALYYYFLKKVHFKL